MMQQLFETPGQPEIHERTSSLALEFWNNFIEYVEELMTEFDENDRDMIDLGKNHILRLVRQLCIKVKSPTEQEWATIEKDYRRAFRDFRMDCKDTIQFAYRILGSHLFQTYVQIGLDATVAGNWYDLEGALFCLVAIGSTDESNDQILQSLLLNVLEKLTSSPGVEQRALRTATDLIGVSTPYFKRHAESLPLALNFLFTCLQGNPKPDDAARAIYHLCDTCREQLSPELPKMLDQYATFLKKPTATQYAIEKLCGAIAFLLQSLPDLTETLAGTKKLIDYVSGGINQAKQLITNGQIDEGRSLARFSMHCLSSIAVSLRAPADIPILIDVDNPQDNNQLDEKSITELKTFQSSVFEIIATVLNVLNDDYEIIEEVCNVFKSGFTESRRFPFHFAPDIVYQFLAISNIKTWNIEAILRMTCAFVKSQERVSGPPDPAMTGIIQHIATLIQSLSSPQEDCEITQGLIEVLERLIPHWISLLLQLQPHSQVGAVFDFTILALELSEPLPKRTAVNFWVGQRLFDSYS
jgi:hypothetical protein